MINKKIPEQFLYEGRYVDTETFCAFVYNENDKKLAKDYKEYQELIASGLWYSSKNAVPKEDIVDQVKKATNIRKLRSDNAFTVPISS